MIDNNQEVFSSEKFKIILLETFRFTVDFLNRHNLSWFVGGGTCIGTVRHKGLIPWDDDIDLFMPRDSYDKLISLREELKGTEYELVSWYTKETMIPFLKIVNRNTTIWEIKYHPYVSGVFIDIFPMDLSAKKKEDILDDMKTYDKCLQKYRSAMSSYSFKDLLQLGIHGRRYFFKEGVLSFFTRSNKKKYLQTMQSIEKENNSFNGSYYILFPICFIYAYEKEILKREWFDDYLTMPFEDLEVRVPIGYDGYLSHTYGNYMQLPPVEKRVTRHYHYYVNLDEGKTIEEIREIKKLEKKREELLP